MCLDPSDVSPTLGEMGLIGTGVVESPFSTPLLYCFFIFVF